MTGWHRWPSHNAGVTTLLTWMIKVHHKQHMMTPWTLCLPIAVKKNAIYPLTIREIVESQLADITMGQLKTKPGYSVQLVKAPWSYAKMTNLSSPRIYKWEQLYGTTITFNTQAPLVSKRLFAVQCIGRVWDIPSNHMSRSVTVARWTNDTCRSMVNCQPNSLSPTLGRYYVWILLDHTLSRARMVHKLTLCVLQWSIQQPVRLRLLNW